MNRLPPFALAKASAPLFESDKLLTLCRWYHVCESAHFSGGFSFTLEIFYQTSWNFVQNIFWRAALSSSSAPLFYSNWFIVSLSCQSHDFFLSGVKVSLFPACPILRCIHVKFLLQFQVAAHPQALYIPFSVRASVEHSPWYLDLWFF